MELIFKFALPLLAGLVLYAWPLLKPFLPFIDAAETYKYQSVELAVVAFVVVMGVFVCLAAKYSLLFVFAICGWLLLLVVSICLVFGSYSILTTNEGISFFMLSRICFHGLILVCVLKLWASHVGNEPIAKEVQAFNQPQHLPPVDSEMPPANGADKQNQRPKLLFVIHGLGGPKTMDALTSFLRSKYEHDRIVALNYFPATSLPLPRYLSNTSAREVTVQLEKQISNEYEKTKKAKSSTDFDIILIGHSAGSVLARKVFLHGCKECSDRQLANLHPPNEPPNEWTTKVQRIVLLSGINRGVDVSGRRPSDMSSGKHFGLWLAAYLSDLIGVGEFTKDLELGSPFIANLRYDWIDYFSKDREPKIVQVRGDIDEVVTEDDSRDLAATTSGSFKALTVSGTGHQDMVELTEPKKSNDDNNVKKAIIDHRKNMIRAALDWNGPQPEAKPDAKPAPKNEITRVVFVLHGIRDYGRWSAQFRELLEGDAKAQVDQKGEPIKVISPRYGYFGMGPFLFGSEREKFVKWFMDAVTEAKAMYPQATFHFVGHSNGTYLLAKALQEYDSLQVENIVFAGSVVNCGYEWQNEKISNRVTNVLNIKANKDWVVALFPQAFEYVHLSSRAANWLSGKLRLYHISQLSSKYFDWFLTPSDETKGFDQPIGSAGYCGFAQVPEANQITIKGGHSAFRKIIKPISSYVAKPDIKTLNENTQQQQATDARKWRRYFCIPVFVVIAIAVIWLGIWVVAPARQYSVQVGIIYVALLVWLLQRI